MSLKSKEERYQEWLERLEVPIEEQATIEDFQGYLAEEFGLSTEQVNALWEAAEYKWTDLEPLGVNPVIYVYETGPRAGQREVRYTIEGSAGLWGWDTAKAYVDALREAGAG